MPGGDRTGPRNLGPMTGRAMGYCAGNPCPGYLYGGPGFRHWRGRGGGLGRGAGFGSGRRWTCYGFPPHVTPFSFWGAKKITPEEELNYLKEEADILEKELKTVQQKIKEHEEKKK